MPLPRTWITPLSSTSLLYMLLAYESPSRHLGSTIQVILQCLCLDNTYVIVFTTHTNSKSAVSIWQFLCCVCKMQWPICTYEIVRRWWNLNFNDDIHRTWQWLSSQEKASDSRAFYCLQSSFAVWKTSLEEKGNHGSFFSGDSEGSLSPVATTGI